MMTIRNINPDWGDCVYSASVEDFKNELRDLAKMWANGDEEEEAKTLERIENISEGVDYEYACEDDDRTQFFVTDSDTLDFVRLVSLNRGEFRAQCCLDGVEWDEEQMQEALEGTHCFDSLGEALSYLVETYGTQMMEYLQSRFTDLIEGYDRILDLRRGKPYCCPWDYMSDWYFATGYNSSLTDSLDEYIQSVKNEVSKFFKGE